jgi:NAD+ diphosphatase
MFPRFTDGEPSRLTGYAGNPLDRHSELRDAADFRPAAIVTPGARFLVIGTGEAVLSRDAGRLDLGLDRAAAATLEADEERAVFLGNTPDGTPWLALPSPATLDSLSGTGFERIDARALLTGGELDEASLGILAQARAVLDWHDRHGFCARCGTATLAAASGWRRECPNCGAQHFPRTDPVAIMLVVHGENCLLGRQPRFAAGMYSCLAGFIEPGETIEDAVRREVREESGIAVGRVAYHASQPWPFPSSLMIGCYGEATSEAITVDELELEDCRWFPRAEVASMLDGTHPDGLRAAGIGAIARRLIEDWCRAV